MAVRFEVSKENMKVGLKDLFSFKREFPKNGLQVCVVFSKSNVWNFEQTSAGTHFVIRNFSLFALVLVSKVSLLMMINNLLNWESFCSLSV